MPRRRRNPALPWMSALEAHTAMWTVLGVRVPQLMMGSMTPAEQTRMVAEKVEAAMESQMAAAEAVGRMLLSPARTPWGAAAAAGDLAHAAMKPYHRKVKANAKRLKKPRSP